MEMEHGKDRNTQRGSATVEAVIGFTAFLFAIFTILGLVNFCRAQMLVSAAVDTAAKEMSQYAYFYEMSGLQKFEGKLDDNAAVGKDNVNEIIGTVDTLYGSLSGAVDQTIEEKTNVQNMLSKGDVDLQTFEDAISNLENSAEGIEAGIEGVEKALAQVGNDPLLYMRSLVAIIGSEGFEVVKRAVAVPLAKAFVSGHFGENRKEANAKLESLGIEGGLDAMNFKLSNIFADEDHQEIEITVLYRVKLLQVFDWVILEAKVSKVAVCRAWLGGDDVIVKATGDAVVPMEPTPPTGGSDIPVDSTNPADPTIPTDPTESTNPTQPTEPDDGNAGGNSSTGNWALQHDPSGYYHSQRCEAFKDQFEEDYRIDSYASGIGYRAVDGEAVGYDFDVYSTWTYESYETMGGNIVDPGPDMLKVSIKSNIEELNQTYTNADGTVQEFGAYTHVVYVPENMPEDQYNRLAADAEKVEAEMKALIENDTTGIPKDLEVNIVIVKSGGQFDYESSDDDYIHIGGEE